MTHDADWRDQAACRDVDPNVMQPETATPEDVEAAIAVCGPCPVWADCRRLAESQSVEGEGASELHGAYGVHAGEWWGPAPAAPAGLPCQWCGGPVPAAKFRPRKFCGDLCRYAARDAARRAAALSA